MQRRPSRHRPSLEDGNDHDQDEVFELKSFFDCDSGDVDFIVTPEMLTSGGPASAEEPSGPMPPTIKVADVDSGCDDEDGQGEEDDGFVDGQVMFGPALPPGWMDAECSSHSSSDKV